MNNLCRSLLTAQFQELYTSECRIRDILKGWQEGVDKLGPPVSAQEMQNLQCALDNVKWARDSLSRALNQGRR